MLRISAIAGADVVGDAGVVGVVQLPGGPEVDGRCRRGAGARSADEDAAGADFGASGDFREEPRRGTSVVRCGAAVKSAEPTEGGGDGVARGDAGSAAGSGPPWAAAAHLTWSEGKEEKRGSAPVVGAIVGCGGDSGSRAGGSTRSMGRGMG